MKKLRGFTLIELLIVVAIIAILAAIAVPNFLEAQVRSKVSRAKADMRSLATAIEAYMVDTNVYLASDIGYPNATVAAAPAYPNRLTFRRNPTNERMATITTPVSYISTLPPDPFAEYKGTIFGYYNYQDKGWILWSFGPDLDQRDRNSNIQGLTMETQSAAGDWADIDAAMETSYGKVARQEPNALANLQGGLTDENGNLATSTAGTARALTYDPTNGTTSYGDVWRIRQ